MLLSELHDMKKGSFTALADHNRLAGMAMSWFLLWYLCPTTQDCKSRTAGSNGAGASKHLCIGSVTVFDAEDGLVCRPQSAVVAALVVSCSRNR